MLPAKCLMFDDVTLPPCNAHPWWPAAPPADRIVDFRHCLLCCFGMAQILTAVFQTVSCMPALESAALPCLHSLQSLWLLDAGWGAGVMMWELYTSQPAFRKLQYGQVGGNLTIELAVWQRPALVWIIPAPVCGPMAVSTAAAAPCLPNH
jgi:hypothetical protein